MLPILRQSRGLASAFAGLVRLTRPDGRANYLTDLYVAISWQIAGDNPVVWQWIRAAVMIIVAVLFVGLAMRIGATPLASAIGGLLLAIAVPPTEGWLFIMGEPLALICLLLIIWLGYGYRTSLRWPWRAAIIALLAACVLTSKEVLGVCLPVVIAVALCWTPDEGWRRPVPDRRTWWLVGALLLVLAAETWSFAHALTAARPGAYADQFGRSGFDAVRALTLLQAMLLPDRFTSVSAWADLYLANLAFLAATGVAAVIAATQPPAVRRRLGHASLGLLAFPVIGAVTYGFWPRYSAFYGIPFFAGSVGLLVLALTEIGRVRLGGALVATLGLTMVIYTATVADRTASYKRSTADLAATLVRMLPRLPRLDSVFIVTPPDGGRQWPITASELTRYASAIQADTRPLPALRDESCSAVTSRLQQPLGRNAVLNDVNPCGPLPAVTLRLVARVPFREWSSLAWRRDSLVIQLLAPAWAAKLDSSN